MKSSIKGMLNIFCKILVLPFAFFCWLEKNFLGKSEGIFLFFAHLFALLPGMPGVFLRRAYYALTMDQCSDHCHIGFGSLFTHRNVIVEDYVYVGAYSMIGSSRIGTRTLIGSRVSILSGKSLHVREADGTWSAFDPSRMVQVLIAPNVWIGEGAIIMADIGEGSMVGAGSVVNSTIKENIIVAGNPARFVRNIEDESPAKG